MPRIQPWLGVLEQNNSSLHKKDEGECNNQRHAITASHSPQEYALVNRHGKTFAVCRRQSNPANWLLTPPLSDQAWVLHSVGLMVPDDLLFENV